MLPEKIKECTIHIREVTIEEVKQILNTDLEIVSAIGHQSTANVLSHLLEREIPANRISITLTPYDTLIVFQLLSRLEEGRILSEEEIKQLKFKFFVVVVKIS
jgi:hypothetical protein